jgi:DNA-binding MarR family transcriptional regulator
VTAHRLPFDATLEVRDRCLCFRAQRAARALGRRFDAVLRPFGLTNGQFSLLVALNRPEPPRLAPLAEFLGMDRATLSLALKPLARRGLVAITPDAEDARGRRAALTDAGHALLVAALPAWRAEHDRLDAALATVLEPLAPGAPSDLAPTLAASLWGLSQT